jgi:hypothetical protein
MFRLTAARNGSTTGVILRCRYAVTEVDLERAQRRSPVPGSCPLRRGVLRAERSHFRREPIYFSQIFPAGCSVPEAVVAPSLVHWELCPKALHSPLSPSPADSRTSDLVVRFDPVLGVSPTSPVDAIPSPSIASDLI